MAAADDELEDGFKEETWPKTCGCGAVWSEEAWERLPYLGVQSGFQDYPDLELRNCGRCSSSIAIVLPRDFA